MLRRLIPIAIAVALLAATGIATAAVAAGPANPLADNLAAAEAGLATTEADLTEATERGDNLRADLAAAYASIDERAERERELTATLEDRKTTISEQESAIEDLDARNESLETVRDSLTTRLTTTSEQLDEALRRGDALENEIDALEDKIDSLEDEIASLEAALATAQKLSASNDVCVITYCTEEAAFGLDDIRAGKDLWFYDYEADSLIADLADHFGLSTPVAYYGMALGSGVAGSYYPSGVIEFAEHGGVNAWTMLHEFAHHLECSTGTCIGHHSDEFIDAMTLVLDGVAAL